VNLGRFFKDNVQTVTWYQHAFFAAIIPPIVAVLSGTGLIGSMLTSWFVLLYFLFREERNENEHKQVGDWRTPDAEGITPLVDDYGDLVGPVTAVFCYTLAPLIYWVVL